MSAQASERLKSVPPPVDGLERRPRGTLGSSIRTHRGLLKRTKNHRHWLIERMLAVTGWTAIGLIALIFVFLFREGFKAFLDIEPMRFFGSLTEGWDGNKVFAYMWQPVAESVGGSEGKYSVLPLIAGSFLVAFPATLISTVFGVGIGIYLSEIASIRVRELVKPVIELLAGIPTVVIGFLCLAVVATIIQNLFHTTFRLNAFVGALGVSLVIIPLITSVTEDALRAVPDHLREASYGLGATKWETVIRVVVPAGISGVTASVLLGMGRAIGETMIVVMATGNAALLTANIFSSVRTMTATIAAEMGAVAEGSPQYHALFLVGAILFTITFVINMVAESVVNRMRKKLKG